MDSTIMEGTMASNGSVDIRAVRKPSPDLPQSTITCLIGREAAMRRLRLAIHKRESQLIWGASGTGKTFLVQQVVAGLSDADRHKCICSSAAKNGRELVTNFLRELYLAGDPFVRKKVYGDRAEELTLNRWIDQQSSLRLRGILFSATESGDYRLFIDHQHSPTHKLARWIEEIMYRCKTPVYFCGHGYSQAEIGHAWSLYWCDRYRTRLGPLTEAPARELLEICIHKFGLDSLDLTDFRTDILRLSGCIPGSIAKMCELAAHPHYHFGGHIKVKLVHLDYLIRSNLCSLNGSLIGRQ
jgi:hypothetical protein